MARNRTITLTGNETKEIHIEDFYDSCVLRSIEASGTGSLSVEWQDALGNWHPFKGGTINTGQSEAVSCRIHGNVINNVRVTSTGFQGTDTVTVTLFFSSDLISSIDEYANDNGEIVVSSPQEQAFDNGRSYRIDYALSMAQNDPPLTFKFIIDDTIDLTLSELNLVEGGVHYEVFADAQVTETAPYETTERRIFPRNATQPSNPSVEFLSGGSFTINSGQEANTNLYVRTASGGGNRQSAVASEQSKRRFPATVVYVRFTILSGVNTDILGTYKLEYEVPE